MSGLSIEVAGMKNAEPPVLVVNGTEYVGTCPSTKRMVMKWAAPLSAVENISNLKEMAEATQIASDFLLDLGFPPEVVEELEVSDTIKAALGFFTRLAFRTA